MSTILGVLKDIINDEMVFYVSNCRILTSNGECDQLLYYFAACKGTAEIHCFLRPSTCNYGNQDRGQD